MWEPQIDDAIRRMRAKAEELGIQHGAGFVLVESPKEKWEIRGFLVKRIDRDTIPTIPDQEYIPGDEGTNYVGIAWMKCAFSMRTGLPSGTTHQPRKQGETPYRGSIVVSLPGGSRGILFFSGSSEDNDVLIAEAGKSALLGK